MNVKLFGLSDSYEFTTRVGAYLDTIPCLHTEVRFSDGENYTKSNVNVRGEDVYVIMSLYSGKNQSVGDKLQELLFFIGSLRDASADKVTIICPYLAYMRQDRKTESRAGIYPKYLAIALEGDGKHAHADRLLTMDVHNLASFQGSFRMPTDNLEAKNLIVDILCGGLNKEGFSIDNPVPDPLVENPDNLIVISPDSGGMGRAKRFRNALEKRLNCENTIEVLHLDKERDASTSGSVRGDKIAGLGSGMRAIIFDDMIASGSTIKLCADAICRAGSNVYAACATHGLFVGKNVHENLANIPRLIVTDTIPPNPGIYRSLLAVNTKLYTIATANTFAKAIRRTHSGGSISDLLES